MSRHAQRVVHVNVEAQAKAAARSAEDSPHKQDYFDADAIAQKYGVQLSDDEDDLSDSEPQASNAASDTAQMQQSAQPVDVFAVDLAARTQQLIVKLDEKNREIERMCTLLEAVQPVEGLDPSKIYDILDGANDMPDYKDAKIVDLAKRLRAMTVQLNKERAKNVQASQRIATLEARQPSQQEAAASATSPSHTQHSQPGSTGSVTGADPAAVVNDQKREIATLHKQVEDLRRRYERSQEELKRTQRLLQKEVGEGCDFNKLSEEGWRGRAQQIVMLKTKLKRLEAAVQDGESVATGKTRTSMSMATTAAAASRRMDVDMRAEADLQAMEREKQRMIEQLSAEHQQLQQEFEQSVKRADAAKARVKVLETEQARAKAQMKVLIQKADTDDSLIQALKDELAAVREQLNAKSTTRRSQESPQVSPSDDTAARELTRLRRLVKQQAEQIAHQESVIVRLRAATDHRKSGGDSVSVDS